MKIASVFAKRLPRGRRTRGRSPAPGIATSLDVEIVARVHFDGRRCNGGLDCGGAQEVDEGVCTGVVQGCGSVGDMMLPELLPRNDDLELMISNFDT